MDEIILFSTDNDVYFACTMIREVHGRREMCLPLIVESVAARCSTEPERAKRLVASMVAAGLLRAAPPCLDSLADCRNYLASRRAYAATELTHDDAVTLSAELALTADQISRQTAWSPKARDEAYEIAQEFRGLARDVAHKDYAATREHEHFESVAREAFAAVAKKEMS